MAYARPGKHAIVVGLFALSGCVPAAEWVSKPKPFGVRQLNDAEGVHITTKSGEEYFVEDFAVGTDNAGDFVTGVLRPDPLPPGTNRLRRAKIYLTEVAELQALQPDESRPSKPVLTIGGGVGYPYIGFLDASIWLGRSFSWEVRGGGMRGPLFEIWAVGTGGTLHLGSGPAPRRRSFLLAVDGTIASGGVKTVSAFAGWGLLGDTIDLRLMLGAGVLIDEEVDDDPSGRETRVIPNAIIRVGFR